MNKSRLSEMELAKLERLRGELPLNKKHWKGDEATYNAIKKYSLINIAAVKNTIILFPCPVGENKTASGIFLAPNQDETQAFGMVVARSPELDNPGGVEVNIGDFIMYNKAFMVKSVSYQGFSFDIVEPHAMLMKVPPSIVGQFVVTQANPITVFKQEVIDAGTAAGMNKVRNLSMPTGMAEGEVTEQRPQGRELTEEEKDQA